MQTPSYLKFVFNDKANKKYLFGAVILSVVEFTIFKILYPLPDIFNDSIWYIFAAAQHLDISLWPIGYSKFLAAFHGLTSSAMALTGFQFFLMQLAALHFFFSMLFIFNPGKFTCNLVFCFFFINPLTLYLSNTVATDTMFGALTILWLAELMWIIFRPQFHQLLITALLCFCCFTLRNTTYYYPFVSAFVFVISKQATWKKLIGILLPALFITLFVLFTREAAYKFTGIRQSSLLTGWQLANNALFIYDHPLIDSTIFRSPEEKELNRLSIDFFLKPDSVKNKFIEFRDGNGFVVMPGSPLKRYFDLHRSGKGDLEAVRSWGSVSAVFTRFGKAIIYHHPLDYLRYFVLPNTWNYLFPALSDLKSFSAGSPIIPPIAIYWFKLKTNRTTCISFSLQGYLTIYAAFFLLLNLYYVIESISLATKVRSIPLHTSQALILSVIAFYLLLNFAFSVSATINILRYQYIPMFILLTFGLLASEMLAAVRTRKAEKQIISADYLPR